MGYLQGQQRTRVSENRKKRLSLIFLFWILAALAVDRHLHDLRKVAARKHTKVRRFFPHKKEDSAFLSCPLRQTQPHHQASRAHRYSTAAELAKALRPPPTHKPQHCRKMRISPICGLCSSAEVVEGLLEHSGQSVLFVVCWHDHAQGLARRIPGYWESLPVTPFSACQGNEANVLFLSYRQRLIVAVFVVAVAGRTYIIVSACFHEMSFPPKLHLVMDNPRVEVLLYNVVNKSKTCSATGQTQKTVKP